MNRNAHNFDTKKNEFISVTERGGELVSQAQVDRFIQRYVWAGEFSRGKDVLELACGTGPGLGYLQKISRKLVAIDISEKVLAVAREYYGNRVDLRLRDACNTGLEECSFDIVILFEAIYYLSDVDVFFTEVSRLLRPGGKLLLATANKDLYDFNPSPYSHRYFNPPELSEILRRHGFESSFFGGGAVSNVDFITRVIRATKQFAAHRGLIPGTMRAKRFLKRIFFGPLVVMPLELNPEGCVYTAPVPIPAYEPDLHHLVLYCVASKV